MTTLTESSKAPYFSMQTHLGYSICLPQLHGKKFILYFYPKADTSGCTKEACAFEDHLSQFEKVNISVIGVSRDPIKKLQDFAEKYALTFPLASDTDGTVTESYGVWVEKSMYGKKYMGIERTTFLINEEGNILKIWPKVKVSGHAEDILKTIGQFN